ncbi:MAG: TolC family protein [Bacteroidales bacterium]|nr:TolC family protein [Bacteroidales bacterium]
MFKQGLALSSDVKNLELSVFNLETVLNNQMLGQNQLHRLLKVFIGLSPDKNIKTEPYTVENKLNPQIVETDTSSYLKRTGYQTLQQTGNLIKAERKIISAGFLPNLTLIGSFGYSGFNPDYKFMQTYNDKWYPTNLVQVTLSVPIFDGLKKTRQLSQNKIKSVQSNNTLEYLKNTYRMEQLNAIDNYNNNMKSLDFQNQNLAQANNLYNQKLLEYKSGLASLNDLISVDNTLKAAQANYINAIISAELAALDLKKANGLLINK